MSEQAILANELHAPARKNFARRKTLTFGIDDLWQADLVEMQELKNLNKGYRYILTIIDTFSKFAWAQPIKDKTGISVTRAFESCLDNRKPLNLQTDAGKEFFNTNFKALMSKKKINHYHTFSDKKAAIVERFNRTLKNKMWKKFTEQNTHNWIDMLDDLLQSYNESKHSTIKMKPIDVTTKDEPKILGLLNNDKIGNKPKFKVGTKVRISKSKGLFEKGYKFNWSEELFVIKKVQKTYPVTYVLEDLSGEEVSGSFYNAELMETDIPDYSRIEKVLKRQIKNGKKYLRIKWKGYDNKFNSWVPEEDVVNL